MGSEGTMKNKINIMQTSVDFMDSIKSKALGYELAEDWILFWTLFMPIALILYFFSKETILIYKDLLYIIFIFAMTIIRRNIVGSFKYLLANFSIVFLTFIISFTFIEKVVFLIAIIGYFIISIKKRKSGVIKFYEIRMLFPCEILMVICYFIAFKFSLTFVMHLITFASINVAISFALYVYMTRIDVLMEWEGEFIKGYSKRMRSIKIKSIEFISGVIIFFIFISWKMGLFKLFDKLTSIILGFFNGSQSQDINSINITPQKDTPIPIKHLPIELTHVGKTSYLMTIVLRIIKYIILLTVFLLAIYLVFKLFIKLKNFYKGLSLKKTHKKEKREFVISLDDIVKELKEKGDKFKMKFELPFNMSNRKKIRKIYKKLVKYYKTKKILVCNFNTPIEIESNIRESLEKNISEATVIYEKARYSDEECSNEDVAKIKSFLI